MPNPEVLKTFHSLAHMAPFTRNVDALFRDFFLAPMSLDSTATGAFPPDVDTDVDDDLCAPGSAAPDGINSPNTPGKSALA